MNTTHVYAGPSLSASAVRRLLPDAVVHPPVRHGDLTTSRVGTGDRVVILDGQFFQSASVRHKEICEVIARGAAVFGAASMGALRAAELAGHGMTGSGVVYRLYSSGLLERDDEVALLHTEPDAGSRALTVALISVRVLLRRLTRHRRITPEDEARLLAAAERLPFTARTWRGILQEAEGVSRAAADVVRKTVAGPSASWDIKTQDAHALLSRLAQASPRSAPRPAPVPTTVHVESWRRTADVESLSVLAAAQVYADDYPALHYRTVLQLISGRRDEDIRLLEQHAADAARRRGLLPDADPAASPLAYWLSDEETTGSRESAASSIARALVRSYRWTGGLAPLPALANAVRATPGAARLDELVKETDQLNAQLAERGYVLHRISRTALHRRCLQRWNTTSLVPALYDRGFTSLDDLDVRARRFAPHLGLADTPRLRLLKT
ncbi:TfuA-like protein [Streptomyces sp. NPDC088254]|uniref:TfuA-like protein n=1 Tax=Streptomyces sp. NPDC088254 TaxID=3365847 RepID=UPI0037FA1CFF